MRKCLVSVVALALAFGQLSISLPRVALAQAPTVDPKTEARERFDRGLRLFNEGDNAGALAEFKRAYELIPNQLVLFNIGLVYAAMSRPAEATEALNKVLADPGNLSAERVARAKQTKDEQAARVAELTVTTNVPSTIEIDNVEAGKTPMSSPLKVASGSRIVGAFATGYAPLRKEVTLAGGTKSEVKLELVSMEGKAAHLRVNTHLPAGDVIVDGQAVGKTPLATSLTVAPGQHKIELRRPGYVSALQDLTLGDGASGEVNLEPEEDRAALATDGGSLALDISETQAVVTIDGKPRGIYAGSYKLPKGPHRVLIERGGFETSDRTVTVDLGRTTNVTVALVPTPETRAAFVSKATSQRTWGWISTLGGVALASGGVTMIVLDQTPKDEANAAFAQYKIDTAEGRGGKCDPTMDSEKFPPEVCEREYAAATKKLNDANARDKIGYAMIGVGGAAALLGVYLLVSAESPHKYDRKTEENTVRLRVVPDVGLRGVTLLGTF